MSAGERRARARRCAATLIAAVWLAAPMIAAAASPLKLGSWLRTKGHADCSLVRITRDPVTGVPHQLPGRLSLEPPDRARLDFHDSGERITLRGDGGEWLQPRLKQMIVFSPERVAGARRWWQLLIDGRAPGIDVKVVSSRQLVLRSTGGDAGPDSASLSLDGAGFPTKLVVPDAGTTVEYQFRHWSFRSAVGVYAFRQTAPKGYERVEFP